MSSNSSKKRTKTSRPEVKSNFFVRFLEELGIPKSPFENNWPLAISESSLFWEQGRRKAWKSRVLNSDMRCKKWESFAYIPTKIMGRKFPSSPHLPTIPTALKSYYSSSLSNKMQRSKTQVVKQLIQLSLNGTNGKAGTRDRTDWSGVLHTDSRSYL